VLLDHAQNGTIAALPLGLVSSFGRAGTFPLERAPVITVETVPRLGQGCRKCAKTTVKLEVCRHP